MKKRQTKQIKANVGHLSHNGGDYTNPVTNQNYEDGVDREAHILYCEMETGDLKKLLKEKIATRQTGKHSAGKDLHEIRKEINRRIFKKREDQKRIHYRKYEKPDEPEDFVKRISMLEDTDKAPNNFFGRSAVIGGLTAKQEKFAMECVATGDMFHSYIAAGYKEGKTMKDTMQRAKNLYYSNKKVRRRIENLKEEALRRMSWNSEKVLEKVAAIYDQAMTGEDFTNANRSMETIARHLGMFVDKSEQKIKMSHFAESDNEEKIQKDIENLADMVGLKVVEGGKK